MKYIACILSLYASFLVALPAIQAFAATSSEDVCCSRCDSDSSEKQDSQDNLPANSQDNPYACNPFEVCTACIGFIVQLFPFATSFSVPSSSEMFVFHYSAPSSAYISSIFQPPQIG